MSGGLGALAAHVVEAFPRLTDRDFGRPQFLRQAALFNLVAADLLGDAFDLGLDLLQLGFGLLRVPRALGCGRPDAVAAGGGNDAVAAGYSEKCRYKPTNRAELRRMCL